MKNNITKDQKKDILERGKRNTGSQSKTTLEFNNAVEKIIEAMENNQGKWKKSWISVIPQNYLTKKPYKGFNGLFIPFLMGDKNHTSPYFLTFTQAKQLKGKVKKGATSYPVFFFKAYYQFSVKYKNGVTGSETVQAFNDKEAEKKVLELENVDKIIDLVNVNPFMTLHRVFNMDDIENIEIDENIGFNNSSIDDIDSFIESTGADIRNGANPYYELLGDYISMPPLNMFVDKENYYATKFHELTHWTGCEKRLNRENFNTSKKSDYAFEELVAELGSLFLSIKFGINTENCQHPEYIKSWIKSLKDNPKYIWKASSLAQKAVNYLEELNSKSSDFVVKKVA